MLHATYMHQIETVFERTCLVYMVGQLLWTGHLKISGAKCRMDFKTLKNTQVAI